MYDRHLDVFFSVVEAGSISAAARESFVSQPAVTQQIAALEARVGEKLFIRTKQGMELTEAGRIFYEGARSIKATAEQTLAKIRSAGQAEADTLRFGVCGRAMPPLYRELESVFHQHFPNKRFVMAFEDSMRDTAIVASGKADICISCNGEFARQRGLAFSLLFYDTVYCFLSKKHPLAGRASIGLEDLGGCRLLLPPKGYSDSDAPLFNYAGLARPPIEILTEPVQRKYEEAVANIAASGIIATMPGYFKSLYPGLAAIPFEGGMQTPVGIVSAAGAKPLVGMFIEKLRAHYGKRGRAGESNTKTGGKPCTS